MDRASHRAIDTGVVSEGYGDTMDLVAGCHTVDFINERQDTISESNIKQVMFRIYVNVYIHNCLA